MSNLGFVLLLIVTLGYLSNKLNWVYLNSKLTFFLYCIGTAVHETSHAVVCFLTGGRVHSFKIFSREPHVTHTESRLPLIGNALISVAPVAGGLLFIYLINHFVFKGHFNLFTSVSGWRSVLWAPLHLLQQFNPLAWQSWVMALLCLNAGAMLGPSFQDIKNIWLVFIILFFINFSPIAVYGWMAINLIVLNIALQVLLIAVLWIVRKL